MRQAFNTCVTLTSRSPCLAQYFRSASRMNAASQIQRFLSDKTPKQVQSFEGYYADLLDAPLHSIRPLTKTQPTPSPPDELPKTEKEEVLAKARVVFGSRLAGPAERREQIDKLSRNIAGVTVPPKPEEPDNCCMSGCVNCVWDRFRDELEEWAERSTEARVKLQEQKMQGGAISVSKDDDGGGSESNWAGKGSTVEAGTDLFADIPIGIREFMKTEKRLKLRHQQDQTQAG